MGNITFANCHDARNQVRILELNCPKCHEQGGIEVFVKDGVTVVDSECEACGYILPERSALEGK